MASKVVVSVRLTQQAAEQIDQARGSRSRAAWIEEAISAALEDKQADSELAKAEATGFAEARKTGACTHPRARVIKGFCYRCGSMVLPKS